MKTKNNLSREIAAKCALSIAMVLLMSVSSQVAFAEGNGVTVVMRNFSFEPQSVDISEGQSITWVNDDLSYHRIVGDNGEFESPIIATGENFTYVFNSSGEYKYHCSIHPSMTGTAVVLKGPAGETTTETNETVTEEVNETVTEEANETVTEEVNETIGNQTETIAENETVENETIEETNETETTQLTIEISSEGFSPKIMTVTAGDKLAWVNKDSTNHKLESDEFNSPDIPPGASYFFSFKTAGNYTYTDIYTETSGQVIVLPKANVTEPEANATNQTNTTEPGNMTVKRPVMAWHKVKISDSTITPQVINGYAGDMVEWFNEENAIHQIKSASFRSPNMTIGDAYGFVFDVPGTYEYSDSLYPNAKGTIIIQSRGETAGNAAETPSNEGVVIKIQGFSFEPANIVIQKGQTVTWVNEDAALHTIRGAGFSTRKLAQGESYSLKMEETGIYNYRCKIHPTERGQIVVK